MPTRHQLLADKAVSTFKELLNEDIREQISEAQYTDLSLIIQEVLSEELDSAVTLLEGVVRQLRAQVEKPDLGL